MLRSFITSGVVDKNCSATRDEARCSYFSKSMKERLMVLSVSPLQIPPTSVIRVARSKKGDVKVCVFGVTMTCLSYGGMTILHHKGPHTIIVLLFDMSLVLTISKLVSFASSLVIDFEAVTTSCYILV